MNEPKKLILFNVVQGYRIFDFGAVAKYFTEKCIAFGYEFWGSKCINFYYDTKVNQLRKNKSNAIEWFIFHRGHLFRVYSQHEGYQNALLTVKENCSSLEENLRGIIRTMDSVIENLEAHNEKYLAKRAEGIAAAEKRAKEGRLLQEKLKAEREAEEEAKYQKSVEQFNGGEKISWEHFEKLCKEKEIKIHIRTLGAARKKIHSLSKTQIFSYLRNKKPIGKGLISSVSELINQALAK